MREKKHGNVTYYNVNRHINPTNICVAHCKLCAFGRDPDAPGAYNFALEEIYARAEQGMREGALHLSPRPEDHTQYTPIDFFFRSLAETAQSASIGVILSGSSSDGALGLREIKAVGGISRHQAFGTQVRLDFRAQ